MLLAAAFVDNAVFVIASVATIVGAVGVVSSRNPVHSALNLVATLFGIAVLFISLQATFLAAVQVIVYAGAIVVLFLFVIMLLGVDREEAVEAEQLPANRIQVVAPLVGVLLLELALLTKVRFRTPDPQLVGDAVKPIVPGQANIEALAEQVFTKYLFAFEVTSALLVIAVVGAVVLARRQSAGFGVLSPDDSDEVVA